jgi:hypothetical protein
LTVHRETLTLYITFRRGGRGESVLLDSVVLHPYGSLYADSDKIAEGGTSTYILHLSGNCINYISEFQRLLLPRDADDRGARPAARRLGLRLPRAHP